MSPGRSDSTVADGVFTSFVGSRVLEDVRIDDCCGGRTGLVEAGGEKGLGDMLSRRRAAGEGREATEPTDWKGMRPEEIIDHIEIVHHPHLRNELRRLSTLVAKVRELHGERHPELVAIQEEYDRLKTDLESHLKQEQGVVFPAIRQLWYVWAEALSHPGGIRNLLRAMEAEHVEVGRALERLRQLSRDYTWPEDACNTYRELMNGLEALEADLHQRIHEENDILFPRVLTTGFAIRST